MGIIADRYLVSELESSLLQDVVISLNHCNVPAKLFASIAYQQHPIPIEIDGIDVWYAELFKRLRLLHAQEERSACFKAFMNASFHLGKLQAKLREEAADPTPRPKVNYRRLLLGWLFDSDNEQGAAWRSWVESRFGLLTCFHRESLSGPDSPAYLRFRQQCTRAIYNTNELYAQLDLLYGFCQYELRCRYPEQEHMTLYRGCTNLDEFMIDGHTVKLFNNLSSFSADPESALRFGSKVYRVQVPMSKIACFESLLPGSLVGEQEFMVIGGLYAVTRIRV